MTKVYLVILLYTIKPILIIRDLGCTNPFKSHSTEADKTGLGTDSQFGEFGRNLIFILR